MLQPQLGKGDGLQDAEAARVRQTLQLALLQHGLPEKAMQALSGSMDATKQVRNAQGTVERPNWDARLKAACFVLDFMVEVGKREAELMNG